MPIKWNDAEFARLLKERVKPDLLRRAKAIAERADREAGLQGGFEASVVTGRRRARASVITATYEARRAEAKNAALTKSLGAGRG